MSTAALQDLLTLPAPERMELAERLWLSVADEATLPVPALHRRILDERLAAYRANKSKPLTHAQLMRRVRTA